MSVDSQLQDFVDQQQQEVNNQLEDLFAAILVTAGSLLSTKKLLDIKAAIDSDVNDFFINANDTILNSAKISEFAAAKLNTKLSPEIVTSIENSIQGLALELKTFLDSKSVEIANTIYKAIISGNSKSEIISLVKAKLETAGLGGTNIRGLKTIVTTNMLELESLVVKLLSKKENIKKWRYVGPTDSVTRQWCKDHVDKVLTEKEIQDWNNSTWAGKKEGDPFITRGGWNCRHHWEPVK